jgi:hypothetical protein
MSAESFQRARNFLLSEGRLLERLLFGVLFEGAPPQTVGRLISACQNPDGGLGHALEPDVRSAESQPLFVEVGLEALHMAGLREPAITLPVCRFLDAVSDETGLVPALLDGALSAPHAAHWRTTGDPDLNPTAGICGLLHYQGIQHLWLTRATRTCCDLLLNGAPLEAHTLRSSARLAEHLPDRNLSAALEEKLAAALPQASFFIQNAPVTTYGLTPLHFAPSPSSPWRKYFSDDQINGHLADLLSKQQDDGGWPIHWTPPGQASQCEWRGRHTFEALCVLTAYGWMEW